MITVAPWQVGQTVADLYDIRSVNTDGGMATVYFVWHKTWKTDLVIKSPKPTVLIEGTPVQKAG